MTQSAVQQGAHLEHITWNSEEHCCITHDNIKEIVVDKIKGSMDFVDVARVVFEGDEGDLFAPLHMLTDFRLKSLSE